MNGASIFGWMLVKSDDYHALLKERQEAKDRADTLAIHAKSLTGQVHDLQGDLNKAVIAKADVEGVLKLCRDKCDVAQQENVRWSEKWAELSERAKAANESLSSMTAKYNQEHTDLLEARKLLWGVPDQLPRDIAENVDWERMGLPVPEGLAK
jgi:chromosome segregation ATPase